MIQYSKVVEIWSNCGLPYQLEFRSVKISPCPIKIAVSTFDHNCRPAAQTAEPLFLPTGAVLSACRRFEISVQKLKKIVRISIEFCIPEFDQIAIEKLIKSARKSIQNSCHSWSSLLKVRSKVWCLDLFGLRSSKLPDSVLNGRSGDAFGALLERARDAPGRP